MKKIFVVVLSALLGALVFANPAVVIVPFGSNAARCEKKIWQSYIDTRAKVAGVPVYKYVEEEMYSEADLQTVADNDYVSGLEEAEVLLKSYAVADRIKYTVCGILVSFGVLLLVLSIYLVLDMFFDISAVISDLMFDMKIAFGNMKNGGRK